jgi:hypothetical protein
MGSENVTEFHPGGASSTHLEKWDGLEDARQASAAQRRATVFEALRENKKAIFWSAIISLSIIMEGYDTGLMPQFFGYPSFREKYGKYHEGSGYQISGPWQVGLVNGSNTEVVIGGFMNGFFAARYGYKNVMLVSLFFMNAFIFITFFAPSVQVLLVGEILCGLTWGVFATTGYANSQPRPVQDNTDSIQARLCLGSLSPRTPRLSHNLRKLVLGDGPADFSWCPRRTLGCGKRMELSHPV